MAGDGSIDRGAWAQLVAELIQRETKGKKLPFARRVGVDPRTIDRWLHQEVVVKEESVRDVARTFNLQAIDLLVQVGYYKATDIQPPAYPNPREDPVIKRIMADSQLTDDERAELVQVQLDLIEADVKRRQAEYERTVGFRQGRRDAS